MFLVSKKELESFPFDLLYEKLTEAGKSARNTLLEDARRLHDREVKRKIEAIYSSREDSYEGDPEADFPFVAPPIDLTNKEVSLARKAALDTFAEKYDLKGNAKWLLPQLVAYIAKLPLVRLEDGKVNSREYFKHFGKDVWHRGIYLYCMSPARGTIVPSQYTLEYRNYSALVPLLLMPHKKYDGVKYSEWSLDGLDMLVDPTLWQLMTTDLDRESYTNETILELRSTGLTYATGEKKGQQRNPVTTYKPYGIPAPLGKYPWIVQTVLLQMWCAHPINRTDLMILDWKDWDSMPKALIEAQVIPEKKEYVLNKPISVGVNNDDWWN